MTPIASERPPVRVAVELVLGNLSDEPTPATVIGRFDEPTLSGAAWVYDRAVGGHLARALEHGALASRLGHLFPLPVPAKATLPPVTKLVLLVGMGTPERFGHDELRMMVTNATAALVDLGYDTFGTLLIGSNRGGVSPGQVAAALLEGVADGLKRVPPAALPEVLNVKVVARDEARLKEHLKHFLAVEKSRPDWIDLHVAAAYRTQPGYTARPPRAATQGDAIDDSVRVSVLLPDPPADRPPSPFARVQFSAVGVGAVLPVREVEVQTFFTDRLPGLFSRRPADPKDPDPFGRAGRLLSTYLLPEEVRGVMADSPAVTLVVDRRTAALPWEMAALNRRTSGGIRRTRHLGVDPGVCRQFRTLAGSGLATPPPLNQSLRVLVIADPAGNLPAARAEGLAVADTLYRVRQRWGTQLDVRVTVRIGPPGDDGRHLQAARALGLFDERAADGEPIVDAGPCDPMEVLGLIADVEYDVIHFAGHGGLVGGRSGWEFGGGCVFSAAELIRARRAPRLVFANACHSGDLGADTRERQLDEQAGLAEAFFARGVHNYIGTGWAVNDDRARELAVAFYDKLLLDSRDREAVLGVALREARKRVKGLHPADPTWGAYQHYGPWNDKLIKLRDPA